MAAKITRKNEVSKEAWSAATKKHESFRNEKTQPEPTQQKSEFVDNRGFGEKVMDTISAPLSQPGTTLKEGFKAGSEAVAESRQKIQEGDKGEAWKTIKTTTTTTAVLAGAVLGAAAIANAVSAGVTKAIVTKGTAKAVASGNIQQNIAMQGIRSAKVIPAATTKNMGLVQKSIAKLLTNEKIVTTAGSPLRLMGVVAGISGVIGTYTFAEWAGLEGIEAIPHVARKLSDVEDPESIQEAIDILENLENPSLWEKIGRLLPGTNIIVGFGKKGKGIRASIIVEKKLAEDRLMKVTTGETDEDKWARINTEREEEKINSINYYNEQRKQMIIWENEAKTNQMEKESEFWRKQREETSRKEREDREAQANFWIEYRKRSMEQQEDTRPSNLGFGLL